MQGMSWPAIVAGAALVLLGALTYQGNKKVWEALAERKRLELGRGELLARRVLFVLALVVFGATVGAESAISEKVFWGVAMVAIIAWRVLEEWLLRRDGTPGGGSRD